MNTAILARPTEEVSTNVPAKQLYWQGFDMYCECALTGDWLSKGEFGAMTPEEKRGYEAASRAAADADTTGHLAKTVDIEAELEDHREWVADQNYWRSGNW